VRDLARNCFGSRQPFSTRARRGVNLVAAHTFAPKRLLGVGHWRILKL